MRVAPAADTHCGNDAALLELARGFYRDELKDHATYTALAAHEPDTALRDALARIAQIELKHSRFWQRFLEARGAAPPPPFRLGAIRRWLLGRFQRFVNSALLVAALELGESNAFSKYFTCLRHVGLSPRERTELRRIVLDEIEHELTFRGHPTRHGRGNVRDYVLGMNDGLVEILGAVTGLSAVYAGNPFVVGVSGLVVGFAGAMSMGIGAFVSVRSQRQVNESLRARMEILYSVAPQRAVSEYRERLEESGVPDDTAKDIAERVGASRDAIANLLLPEPQENELRSGLYTGLAYLLGVAFPVVPYFFAPNAWLALTASVVLAGIALSATGLVISILSGISLRRKVGELLTAGFTAAAIAYVIGWLLRATTGIEL